MDMLRENFVPKTRHHESVAELFWHILELDPHAPLDSALELASIAYVLVRGKEKRIKLLNEFYRALNSH